MCKFFGVLPRGVEGFLYSSPFHSIAFPILHVVLHMSQSLKSGKDNNIFKFRLSQVQILLCFVDRAMSDVAFFNIYLEQQISSCNPKNSIKKVHKSCRLFLLKCFYGLKTLLIMKSVLRKQKFKFTLYKFGSLDTVYLCGIARVKSSEYICGHSTFNKIYYRIVDVIITVISVGIAITV